VKEKNLIQLVLAIDSSFFKGEVGGSRQQQGVTSQASPAGRYATSWIFIERLIEKPALILIRNFVMYVWC
jgi:hypothetical protein